MAPDSDEPVEDPPSSPGSEPLVPILRLDDGQVDPMAIATWHQALSDTALVEVPHDLMGLWLYPSQGGVVLLGPSELAADDLAVPLPSPHLTLEQLSLVEEVVVDAGYGSATCLPIRFGERDVALLLVADLQPGRYGPAERVLLQCVAQRVAPMLGRIAQQWAPAEGSSSPQIAPIDEPPSAQRLELYDPAAETLFRIAGLLATTSDPALATHLIAEEGTGLLPFDKVTFALRLTEDTRVVLLEPGERRALPELPLVPVAGTALERVLHGQAPSSVSRGRGETQLIVPLRVAGKVHGALVFSAGPPASLDESHLGGAQRLADIVAAHFELLRRDAMLRVSNQSPP